MDNPNYPLMIVTQTARWFKVMDSQLDKAIAQIKGVFHIYRVSHEARLIRKRTGEFAIRATVCKGPYKYKGGRLTNA
jgi:hypothetical protein